MSKTPSSEALLDFLTSQFARKELAPPRRNLQELAEVAARLVPLYLHPPKPLRRSAIAKRLATLSRNLRRAAKAASELGEQGISHMFVASGANREPETDNSLRIISDLQDWAEWSAKAAKTAKEMSLSARDHKGGRTPDARLRRLAIILMNRYETLLGLKASHTVDPSTGLGDSTFDRFVREAIRLNAPKDTHFSGRQIDDAVSRALPPRAKRHVKNRLRSGRRPE